MIFSIVLILAAILGGILGDYKCNNASLGITLGVAFSVIICFITCIFALSIPEEKIYVLESTQNIVAITDGSNASDSFYIFGRTIKDKFVYRYAYKDEMGIRIKTLDAADCVIAYTDGQPQIEKYSVYYKHPVHRALTHPCIIYKILVPKGTVTTKYEVDLK